MKLINKHLMIIVVIIVCLFIAILLKVNIDKDNMINELSEVGATVDESKMKEDIKTLAYLEHMNIGDLIYIGNNGDDRFLQYKDLEGDIDNTKKVIEVFPAAKKAKYEKENFIEIRFIMRIYLYLKQRHYDFEIIAISMVYKPRGTPVFTKDNEIDEYIRNLDKIYKEIYYEGASDEELITKMTEKWIEDTGYVRISYK